MKMKLMMLLATLLLGALPSISQADGAPAIPMVVCHTDHGPQMLVPEYICREHGGHAHY
ncbi:MAG: hypothetical protein ACRDBT_07240 [Aeromonas sp.]